MSVEPKLTEKNPLMAALFKVGAHFGFSKSRNHPSVKERLFGYKNRSAVIDLERTVVDLARAKEFLAGLGAAGQTVLWVGNKDEARPLIAAVAERLNAPFVASRWLGGTLTNFAQIRSRTERLLELRAARESGALTKYTKKERLLFDKEIAALERHLVSLIPLNARPAALVVVDVAAEEIAVTEARQTKIPVVGLSGSDNDIRGLAYPIVANDANSAAIKFLLNELAAAYEGGKTQALATPVGTETVVPAALVIEEATAVPTLWPA